MEPIRMINCMGFEVRVKFKFCSHHVFNMWYQAVNVICVYLGSFIYKIGKIIASKVVVKNKEK